MVNFFTKKYTTRRIRTMLLLFSVLFISCAREDHSKQRAAELERKLREVEARQAGVDKTQNERISLLEAKIQLLDTMIFNLELNQSLITSKISSIESEIDSLQSFDESISTNISSILNDISNLHQNLSSLSVQTASLESLTETHEIDISSLKVRITSLEASNFQTLEQVNQLITNAINAFSDDVNLELNTLMVQYTNLTVQLGQLQTQTQALETYTVDLQSQIDNIVLDTNDSMSEIYDPCGDGSGFDEVIFKTVSGKFVAYFESGNKRFLSLLPDGTYQTTDQQACTFTINSGIINPAVKL
jgi:chromosome segregation ATPase